MVVFVILAGFGGKDDTLGVASSPWGSHQRKNLQGTLENIVLQDKHSIRSSRPLCIITTVYICIKSRRVSWAGYGDDGSA